MESIIGEIERITFYNDENGYTVLRIIPQQQILPKYATGYDGTVTVVGNMPEMMTGEMAEFKGEWVDNPRYGMQFKAEQVLPKMPTTEDGIINYLSSGIVSGIGPRTAEKIVDHFGEETIEILDTDPERIHEVYGLKTSLADQLIEAWGKNRAMRDVLIYLQGYGITSKMANRIYGEYGSETRQIVETDPYKLADDVFLIGFKKADEIAQRFGISPDSRNRIRAGLRYALNHLSNDGHTFAPRELLLETTKELLGVEDGTRIQAVLDVQLLQDNLKRDQFTDEDGQLVDAIYLPMFYYSEVGSTKILKQIAYSESKITMEHQDTDWAGFLQDLSDQNDVELTMQQQSAVRHALMSKLSVLTGGPGTGKTTTLQMVIHALQEDGFRFALASPTGRAAKRLSEATGHPASTIHRLLGFSPDGGFDHNEDNPLEIDMLIVDEASMIDLILYYNLLKALEPTTHLMLVGDVDQLPSVGAGNVLRDMIDSGIAHVTRLGQIFRQDEMSHIVVNAHRINNGEMPYVDNESNDFFFFNVPNPNNTAEMIVDVVTRRVPERFGFDPLEDIQVLAPMYRGPAGVSALNSALQHALNGDSRMAQKKLFGLTFRVGDKVMQTKNNYEKDVFNGDIGRLIGIDFEDSSFEILMDGRYVFYEFSEADQLIHAYCISTHRSQGSEYPVVVMPILTQHYMMLQRNLLYTAITRAKQLVVLVGDRKATYIAVNNNKVAERHSGLLPRLQGQ